MSDPFNKADEMAVESKASVTAAASTSTDDSSTVAVGSNSSATRSILHRGKDALDRLKLRFSSTTGWKDDIPNFPPTKGLSYSATVIPNVDRSNKQSFVVFGGHDGERLRKSVSYLEFYDTPHNPVSSKVSFPDLNESRIYSGAVCVDDKLFMIGGARSDTFEVLNLADVKKGWTLHQMPRLYRDNHLARLYFGNCQAVTVDNRYIYVAAIRRTSSESEPKMSLFSYDTKSCSWDTSLEHPKSEWYQGYTLTSIVVPHKGTYVVVVGGLGNDYLPILSVEAYHVESKKWIQLPSLPDTIAGRKFSDTISLGGRYILVAGGSTVNHTRMSSVITLDWAKKEWFELPSLPEGRSSAAGAYVGTANRWILAAGVGPSGHETIQTLSLEVSSGIGWATEKLLLLCFRKKAQKKKTAAKGPCLLENLDHGVFASILSYLFVPFHNEMTCNGSIFAGLFEPLSPESKRKGSRAVGNVASKRLKTSE